MSILLSLTEVKKHYPVKSSAFSSQTSVLKAVDGLSLEVEQGECLGLVGESGCGKSTLARLILKLEKPTDGRIVFSGRDISKFRGKDLQTFRRQVQIIFQDPYSSLNPRMSVGAAIGEPFVIHHIGGKVERREKVLRLMSEVGLRPEHISRYPHEFSGGQRQRIGIARALALNPDLIVADEPVSALDVSIQAQVINLLKGLQKKYNLTYVFIAHDLSLVRHVSDRVAVMYLGKLMEIIPKQGFGNTHHHPYTLALLASIPVAKPGLKIQTPPLTGDVPSPIDPPTGCPFHPRCPERIDICLKEFPPYTTVSPEHIIACHRR